MAMTFADTLRELRIKQNLSQQQLANKLFVSRSSVAHWETGRHIPDAVLLSRIAQVLGIDISVLITSADAAPEAPCVIIVDDEELLLAGALPILSEAMPGATITGFSRVSEAVAFAGNNRISIAFLDIELGKRSGLELSRTLAQLQPLMNIIFLTSYPDYSLDAWKTPACGFLVKPLRPEDLQEQLRKLRYPVIGLDLK